MTVTALELPSRMRTEVALAMPQTYGLQMRPLLEDDFDLIYSTDQICILSFVLLLALLFALHTPSKIMYELCIQIHITVLCMHGNAERTQICIMGNRIMCVWWL